MGWARAIGSQIVRQLAPTSLSKRGIMRAVRRTGYGYRNEDMLSDINYFRGVFTNTQHIRDVHPERFLTPGDMAETQLKRPVRYQVHGIARVYDPETDQSWSQRVSMYTNERGAKAEYREIMMEEALPATTTGQNEVWDLEVTTVMHNEGFPYE